ncbi:hypothetical protein L218DRAFT_957144 [Marasmius fiardii PR-910]|nr:hypothetical protein L218DRAFT_957144 [Marasmius fiardii PR-910]
MDPATNQDPMFTKNIKFYLVNNNTNIAVPIFFYGVYAVLYGACMIILRGKKMQYHGLYVIALTVLFVLATFGAFVNTFVVTEGGAEVIIGQTTGTSPSEEEFSRLITLSVASFLAYILSNLVADTLLLFRCYHVWDHRMTIILFPAILCIGCNALGIAYVSHSFLEASGSRTLLHDSGAGGQPLLLAFAILDLLSNMLLTVLIATKLVSIIRQARRAEVKSVQTMYTSIMTIILETGVIYPIGLVALLAVSNNAITYSLIHFVGIAPTLIIVRIGLGTALQTERGCIEMY